MTNDNWTDRLSEYIDGEMSPQDARALEAHLAACSACARTLQELRAVVTRAANVLDRAPENDLWDGIAEAIAHTPVEQRSAAVQPKRRVSFSVSQLVAAGIVLTLLSAGSMYLLVTPSSGPAVAGLTPAATDSPITTDQAVARPVAVESPAAANYDVAIRELESALRDGQSSLDSATVRVLQTNLHAIDVAIQEARAALSRDPGSPYLNRYLDETMQRKIQLLRRATGIVRART